MLTPADVAKMLNCSVETIKKLLRERDLPGIKPAGEWLIPRDALVQTLHEQAMNNVKVTRRRQLPTLY